VDGLDRGIRRPPQRLVDRVAADSDTVLCGRFVREQPEQQGRRPVDAYGVLEADVAVGEGTGLVGEQDLDVAEVLDADQPLDQYLLPGHAPGAGGQAGGHDRR
jgi:hypothetical protein